MSRGIDGEIVERHASEVALLWPLRDAAVRDSAYDLALLSHLDERVEANLDGLRLAGDAGWAAARVVLEEGGSGETFAAAAIAVDRGDLRGIATVLDVAAHDPKLGRAFVSALAWCRFEAIERLLPGLFSSKSPPALHLIGIAACAAHRRHPGPALANATASTDARLRARAVRAVGEIGTGELLAEVRADLASADDACRFAAGWTCTLLGELSAPRVLCDMASNGSARAIAACDVAMRRASPAEGSIWLEHLSRSQALRRVAIAGAAALGDPSSIPWLLDLLEDEEVARPALQAVMTIVGVDAVRARFTERERKKRKATDSTAEDMTVDPDAALAWPKPDPVRGWWAREASRYPRGTRLMLGRPLTPAWLGEVLRRGTQQQRAAAALELALAAPGRPLFEVRAPAFRQRMALR